MVVMHIGNEVQTLFILHWLEEVQWQFLFCNTCIVYFDKKVIGRR